MLTPSSRLLDRIRRLIATPSVSSVSPQFDQSNRPVIDLHPKITLEGQVKAVHSALDGLLVTHHDCRPA